MATCPSRRCFTSSRVWHWSNLAYCSRRSTPVSPSLGRYEDALRDRARRVGCRILTESLYKLSMISTMSRKRCSISVFGSPSSLSSLSSSSSLKKTSSSSSPSRPADFTCSSKGGRVPDRIATASWRVSSSSCSSLRALLDRSGLSLSR